MQAEKKQKHRTFRTSNNRCLNKSRSSLHCFLQVILCPDPYGASVLSRPEGKDNTAAYSVESELYVAAVLLCRSYVTSFALHSYCRQRVFHSLFISLLLFLYSVLFGRLRGIRSLFAPPLIKIFLREISNMFCDFFEKSLIGLLRGIWNAFFLLFGHFSLARLNFFIAIIGAAWYNKVVSRFFRKFDSSRM